MACLPLCCPECCTHRLFTPLVEWSDNVVNRKRCGKNLGPAPGTPPAVIDSVYFGGVFYLLAEIPRKVDGVVRFGYRAEAWQTNGLKLWQSDILLTTLDGGFTGTDRTLRGCIASDGDFVWVALAVSGYEFSESQVFRLDALDGSTLYEGDVGAGEDLLVECLCPIGDGTVYIGHEWRATGNGTGFVTVWDDDALSGRFGAFGCGSSDVVATSIIVDGSTVYVGHSPYAPNVFAGIESGSCAAGGFVSKYNGSKELIWVSYGPGTSQPSIRTTISKSGAVIFASFVGTSTSYVALETTWGEPTFLKTLEYDTLVDLACGATIYDLDSDDDFLWLAVCRWVYQCNLDGTIVEAVPHVLESDIEQDGSQVKTVASSFDGAAEGGGWAVPCDPLDPEDRTNIDADCGEFVPGCSDAVGPCGESPSQEVADWCHVNECGSISTNGRVALDECTNDQWPPCSGPGFVSYVGCDDIAVQESFTFTSACIDGGRRWTGTWSDGTVQLDYVCGEGISATVTVGGCTTTDTYASLECDGPLGYAAVYWGWTADCGECTINGCGAMNADECKVFGCSECTDGAPSTYAADMAGFDQGAGSCATCSSIATVNLAFVSNVMGDCTWEGEMTFCSEVLTVRLTMMSGTVKVDVLNGGGFIQATYTADDSPFDCLGGGSFSRTFFSYTGTECTVWPTSISLTAA